MNKSGICTVAVLGLLATAGAAFGQNCANGVNPNQCNPIGNCNGADVIVGDLNGVTNYTSAGGIEAFSIGTTSCNIGNAQLLWIANNNQHPVIGGGAFKLKTLASGVTTFEQIGQSWLKHGFFALSQDLCCAGCQGTDGSRLGIHCSDPYTSARNGSQGGLGPKWQVNANTGAYTYPPANPGFSGSVARRLQVAIADLEVSSTTVRYFVSGHYVTPDDAAARNQNNNQSYRGASISGSGTAWNMNLTGSTQRTQPAIRAWADSVPNVAEADVQVPSEGLFLVAMQATDIGGGMWHYEYAVQNLNSDRSGGTFEVPVPAGVLVTNIGFHDVNYHSGDGPGNVNFSSTDWTSSKADNTVSDGTPLVWSTQTFAVNPNANALRWGTLYNFRFDANVAPVAGEATIGLFKTGIPASVTSPVGRLMIPGTPPPPECACDYNSNGSLNSQDFFDFVADLLSDNINADYNGDGVITSQDFFDFLTCFLAPPQGC
ncbi:MAG: hypothetical protein H7210_11985 [Pyrinomonadaceae bacterium]|nr:hypothetical protein [Phycisphaerales bacterium]